MIRFDNQYSKSFFTAIGLHIVLLSALFIDVDANKPTARVVNHKPDTPIVNAVSVNQQQVEKEMARITAERDEKRNAEHARQKQLARQAARAKSMRKQEEARLRDIKKQNKRAEQQRIAKQRVAAKRLAKIKQRQKQEKQRLASIKKQQQAIAKRQQEAKRQAALVAKRKREAAKQRQANAKRRQQQMDRMVKLQGEINKYKALVVNAIENHWNYPDDVNKDLSCRLKIRLAPGGVVMNVAIVQSSGNRLLDRSAEIAVYKASPLPVPSEPDLFEQFRVLNLRVRPQGKV